MDKVDKFQNESASKGNSEDSLLAIYILSVLKKYSSHDNKLSSQDVMDYLKKDYSICALDEADPQRKKVMEAQRKKVRRHLDTLSESSLGSPDAAPHDKKEVLHSKVIIHGNVLSFPQGSCKTPLPPISSVYALQNIPLPPHP